MPSTVSSLNLEPWCLVSTRRLHVQSPTWNVHIMMHVQRVRRYSTAFTTKVLNRNPECRSIRIVNYLLVYWSIHSFSHSCLDWSFIYWPYLSIHQFINSFIHSYLYSLIDLFEGLFIYVLTCISIYVFICVYVYLLNYMFICLLLYVFNVHLRCDVCVCRVDIYCLCVHPKLNTCSL